MRWTIGSLAIAVMALGGCGGQSGGGGMSAAAPQKTASVPQEMTFPSMGPTSFLLATPPPSPFLAPELTAFGDLSLPAAPPPSFEPDATNPPANGPGTDLTLALYAGNLPDPPPWIDPAPTFQLVNPELPGSFLKPLVVSADVEIVAIPEPVTMLAVALAGMVLLEFTSRRRGPRSSLITKTLPDSSTRS